jgi:hypothetical protein
MGDTKQAAIELDQAFWKIYRAVAPDDDIKPMNLESEKEKFYSGLKAGKPKNPTFTYRLPAGQDQLRRLSDLIDQASALSGPQHFVKPAQELISWISHFSERSDGFPKWLYSVYGKPNAELVTLAQQTLDRLGPMQPATEDDFDVAYASRHFAQALEQMQFADWTVQVVSMPARVLINAPEQAICINETARFSLTELKRLVVHEIGTHVIRAENGSKQEFDTFRFGFSKYMACEEGLAIFSEQATNQLTDSDLGKYCLRVIACNLAETSDFCDVFAAMNRYVSTDLAFRIALRVKRGLTDTSEPFGYSKDQVYLDGFEKVKAMTPQQIRQLYVGKIGFSEAATLNFDLLNQTTILYPPWVQ